jgi:hypothetical protein
VKVVAVPASTATWVKFVQLDPLQRAILISVWSVVPFVHVRPIEPLVSAVAVRFVGAATERAFTTMERVVVLDAPLLSVTVRDAVYVPGVVYRWVVRDPVPKAPSPNDQAHDVTVPSGSVDPEPSKATLRGAAPVEGRADITAVGGQPLTPARMLAMLEYGEYPPALKARTRYL